MKSSNSEKNKAVQKIQYLFQKIKGHISVSDGIQIVMAFLSLLSFMGVICTLAEMKKERDTAYRPTVLMNPEEYQISWDENKEEEWLSSLPNKAESTYKINDDGSIDGTVRIPMAVFPDSGLENFTVVNVGVGVSKDVCFEWNDGNIENLLGYLLKCDATKSDFCTYDKSAAFSFGNRVIITDIDRDTKLMYMLADAAEKYTIPLPMAYTILIHEIMKTDMLDELPYIILSAEYKDIQGKVIKDHFFITIERTSYKTNENGSGSATFQLNPTAF